MKYINKIKQVKMSCYKAIHLLYYFLGEWNYMSKNGTLTVPEASRYTGKCINTIRRYIKKGVLHSSTTESNGIQVITVEKLELDKVFKISWNPEESRGIHNEIQGNPEESRGIHYEIQGNPEESTMESKGIQDIITKDNLRDVIQEFFESKQTQLMRPMEEHAFYIVGELKNEVKHLQAEKETLRQENEILKQQIKALPGPAELEQKEDIILLLQKEKEEQIRKTEGLNQVLLDNANNIKELTKERENFQSALKEQEATIREKEKALKELEELHRAELGKVLKQAEEKQIEISEAWKKELELAKRPWWKFW